MSKGQFTKGIIGPACGSQTVLLNSQSVRYFVEGGLSVPLGLGNLIHSLF